MKAIVFGTFAPMHRGHVDLIQRAKRENDEVIVIVSGYKKDRGDMIGLSLNKRFRYIRELFANDSLVSVEKLDESKMPRYPEGWNAWLAEVEKLADMNDRSEYIFYVSEKEYAKELTDRSYNAKFGDRNFNISASKIRETPEQYWEFIAPTFYRHFRKRVLVIGSASNGKTTLCQDLSRYFNAEISLEYAREYQTTNDIADDELEPKDYYWLLLGQFNQTAKLIDSQSASGLVIADTDAIITKAYYDHYIKDASKIEDQAFRALHDALVAKESWDLIIFVEPNGEYVNDGFRDMTMSENSIRKNFSEYVDFLRWSYFNDTPTVYLNGNYADNYSAAIKEIKAIYKQK